MCSCHIQREAGCRIPLYWQLGAERFQVGRFTVSCAHLRYIFTWNVLAVIKTALKHLTMTPKRRAYLVIIQQWFEKIRQAVEKSGDVLVGAEYLAPTGQLQPKCLMDVTLKPTGISMRWYYVFPQDTLLKLLRKLVNIPGASLREADGRPYTGNLWAFCQANEKLPQSTFSIQEDFEDEWMRQRTPYRERRGVVYDLQGSYADVDFT